MAFEDNSTKICSQANLLCFRGFFQTPCTAQRYSNPYHQWLYIFLLTNALDKQPKMSKAKTCPESPVVMDYMLGSWMWRGKPSQMLSCYCASSSLQVHHEASQDQCKACNFKFMCEGTDTSCLGRKCESFDSIPGTDVGHPLSASPSLL